MKTKKTLLVLTEHFPPSNSGGANRAASWAKHLPPLGIYPVFFTPNTIDQKEYTIAEKETYEVHYIQCRRRLVSRLRIRFAGTLAGRVFGLLERVTENIVPLSPLRALRKPAVQYVRNNPVSVIVATAPSYSLFGIAAQISELTQTKWIADYRDDWTTSEVFSGLHKSISSLEVPLEMLYLKNASAFSSVSPWYVRKIQSLIRKPGHLLENGFEPDSCSQESRESPSPTTILTQGGRFQILYPGTLYPKQRLAFVRELLDHLDPAVLRNIKLTFLGMDESSVFRNDAGLRRYRDEGTVAIYSRLPKVQADRLIADANLLLYIAHQDGKGLPLKGIPSSKLYDYIKHEKFVLLAPSDQDFAEQKLKACGLAISPSSAKNAAATLENLVAAWRSGHFSVPQVPADVSASNTRQHAAGRLDEIIKKVLAT